MVESANPTKEAVVLVNDATTMSSTGIRSRPNALDMRGLYILPEDGLVSSLALTPDGCYVFAGFGGGEVRLFAQALRTVGAAGRTGTIVAQIKSKGMFSNTKVDCHVEASEDGRFVFAGLLRGSSEMLALDITDLPRWGTLPTREEKSLRASRFDLNRRIRTYAHSDGKLKGFGAAAVVRKEPERSQWGEEYRLFCGRGIKNIHVWSFKPASAGVGGGQPAITDAKSLPGRSTGEWVCLYDTHTNGATVELVAFRNGGFEGISKSTDANVRVWDLSDPEKHPKPTFRDISNSKDTRIVFGDYAYGGSTALSLVKLDAPAVANRMEIGLPEGAAASPLTDRRSSPSSSRGKRHCRMLKDLAGTQDGRHVVLVCSDGTVLYHRHTQAVNTMKLQPLEGLGVDEEDTRPTVSLSLAGREGLPVLMIAGGKGRTSSINGRGEEPEKELELMALPRSDAQERDDAQRGDSLGRLPLGPWPAGRRLTSEDETYDNDFEEAEGDCGVGRNGRQGNGDDNSDAENGSSVDQDNHQESSNVKDITEQSSEAVSAHGNENGHTAGAGDSASSGIDHGVKKEQATKDKKPMAVPSPPPPVTPVMVRPNRGETAGWMRIVSSGKAPSPAALPLTPASTPSPSRLVTPVHAGRKRARVVDGKVGGSGGNSPRVRSTGVVGATPSPASGSSTKGRKKRGPGAAANGGVRPRAGSGGSTGRSSPASTPKISSNGIAAARAAGGTEKPEGKGLDGAKRNNGKGEVVGANVGSEVVGRLKISKDADSVDKGGALGGLAAAAVALAAAAAGGGKVALDLDKELIESARSGVEAEIVASTRFDIADKSGGETEVAARENDVARPSTEKGLGAGAAEAIAGEVEQGTNGDAAEDAEKRKGISVAASVAGINTGSANKRLGKKRAREDGEKAAEDESGGEDGKAATTQKRGRREDGTATRAGKPRRGAMASADGGAGSSSGGGGGNGGGGNDQQLLLRDRRSRIAARTLRSSGGLFEIAALAKGMGSGGWLAGPQEPPEPELRVVVRIKEKDCVIEPPAVPAEMEMFLSTRWERRSRETTPISLEQARARYARAMRLLPNGITNLIRVGDKAYDAGSARRSADEGAAKAVGKGGARTDSEEDGRLGSAVKDVASLVVGKAGKADMNVTAVADELVKNRQGKEIPLAVVEIHTAAQATNNNHTSVRSGDALPDATAAAAAAIVSALAGAVDDARAQSKSAGTVRTDKMEVDELEVPAWKATSKHSTGSAELEKSAADGGTAAASTKGPVSNDDPDTRSQKSEEGKQKDEARKKSGNVNSVPGFIVTAPKAPGEAKATDATAAEGAAKGAVIVDKMDVDDSDDGVDGKKSSHVAAVSRTLAKASSAAATAPHSEDEEKIGSSAGGDVAATETSWSSENFASADSGEATGDAAAVSSKVGLAHAADRGLEATSGKGKAADEKNGIEMDRGKDARVTDGVQDADTTENDDFKEKTDKKNGKERAAGVVTEETFSGARAADGVMANMAYPDMLPPPMEAVIQVRREDGERGSGGGTTDRLYGTHCLEREVTARSFFREQDLLRRRFQAVVDVVELDKAVECAGLELRSGCRTMQTIKMRLKTRWREGVILPNGGGLGRCTSKEVHQAEQKWQEQVKNVIADHRELLRELMGRQKLEARTLQMSQKMEVTRGNPPLLQVRFAFPRMFEEVAERHSISL